MDERAPKTDPRRSLWSGRIWPVLAGAVAAAGIFAAGTALGAVALLMVYATVSIFSVTIVWGLSLETGIERTAILSTGLYAGLVVLVALGLGQVHPQYGPLVGLVIGLSSPAALSLLAKAIPQTRRRRTVLSDRPVPEVLMDKARLDRRFDEIVSQLAEPGESPEI
jgi:hypothetical protein